MNGGTVLRWLERGRPGAVLVALRDSLTIDIPRADLRYSDAFAGMTWDVTDAQYVGLESLGEVAVHHLQGGCAAKGEVFQCGTATYKPYVQGGAIVYVPVGG